MHTTSTVRYFKSKKSLKVSQNKTINVSMAFNDLSLYSKLIYLYKYEMQLIIKIVNAIA